MLSFTSQMLMRLRIQILIRIQVMTQAAANQAVYLPGKIYWQQPSGGRWGWDGKEIGITDNKPTCKKVADENPVTGL